jgi:hypothetical protein
MDTDREVNKWSLQMTSVPSVEFVKLTICLKKLTVIFYEYNYGKY